MVRFVRTRRPAPSRWLVGLAVLELLAALVVWQCWRGRVEFMQRSAQLELSTPAAATLPTTAAPMAERPLTRSTVLGHARTESELRDEVLVEIVFEVTGAPARGAEVVVDRDGTDKVHRTADEDGTVVLDAAAANGRLVARCDGAVGALDLDKASMLVHRRLMLRQDSPFRVVVTAHDGRPANGVPLAIRAIDSAAPAVRLGATGADGALLVSGTPLLPTPARVFVAGPGLEDIGDVWSIDAGARELALALPPTAMVTIDVRSCIGPRWPAIAQVRLAATVGDGLPHNAEVHDGEASFPHVAKGRAYVATARLGAAIATVAFMVGPGADTVRTTLLAPSVLRIRGRAVAATGLAGATRRIWLRGKVAGQPIAIDVPMSADGDFVIALPSAWRDAELVGSLDARTMAEGTSARDIAIPALREECDLGEVLLLPRPELARGRIVGVADDREVAFRVEQCADDGAWLPTDGVEVVRTGATFVVRGAATTARMRLCASTVGRPSALPMALRPGDRDLVVDLASRRRELRLCVVPELLAEPGLLVVECTVPGDGGSEVVDLEADRGVLVGVLPANALGALRVRGRGFATPLFAIDLPMRHSTDCDEQPPTFDLRSLSATELQLFAADGNPFIDELALLPIEGSSVVDEELQARGGWCRCVAPPGVDLLVLAEGHRAQRVATGGRREVRLQRGFAVALRLQGDGSPAVRRLRLLRTGGSDRLADGLRPGLRHPLAGDDVELSVVDGLARCWLPDPGVYDVEIAGNGSRRRICAGLMLPGGSEVELVIAPR